jgi:peptide/nickel transport system substrate-binding protein
LGCGPAPRKADLVIGVEQEPSSLDPRVGSDVAADRAFRLLYRGLFDVGPDFRPVPDLVESWSQPSPTRYIFRLKRGIRFSDGRPLTARDAAYTLDSVRTAQVPSFKKGDLDRIASIISTSAEELAITLREPFPPILSALNLGVVPEGTRPGDPPVGAGPYRLKSWVRGLWLVFDRNPYAEVPPATSSVAFKVIPDPVVRSLEMRRGSVDLVVNDLPPDTLEYFEENGYPIHRAPGASYAYIGLNCAHPPLDRPEVRRALALALNRNALIRFVLQDFARPATGLLCPEHWAYDPAGGPLPYDPGAAERLLDTAGMRRGDGGVRFALDYKTSENKVSRLIAVAAAQDFALIGVDVSVRSLEWGTFYGDVKRGDFDCFGLTWVGITDPDGFRLRFSSLAFAPEGLNRGRYANPEVDRLVEEGARETDPIRREALYERVQRLLARDAPYISLWWPDAVCVTQKDVTGVNLPPDGNFSFIARVKRKSGGQ